ncbi:MAG: M16 family metallopeptidase [Myxococcaceae bacterium]
MGVAALVLAGTLGCGRCAPAVSPIEKKLPNGLTAGAKRISGAREVALVVLYRLGGDHDPEGASGLAHLVEHVYVTAAAGALPARSADALVARYPAGWNAQTGSRYTVLATVFPPEALEGELAEAAARMGELRITDADVQREVPRVLAEVGNMFGGIPALGAANLARERLLPTARGGRKGGAPAEVSRLGRDEVEARWRRLYKPANATVFVAGAVDAAAALGAIERHFAAIAPGEPAPEAAPGPPIAGGLAAPVVLSLPGVAPSQASLAFRAPPPSSADFAPFLVLVARLGEAAPRLGAGTLSVRYSVLDEPEVLYVSAPLGAGEDPEAAITRLDGFVASAAAAGGSKDQAKGMFGFHLGTVEVPEALAANNVYGAAFSLARRPGLGVSGAALAKALEATTEDDVRRVAASVFDRQRRAAAVVTAP